MTPRCHACARTFHDLAVGDPIPSHNDVRSTTRRACVGAGRVPVAHADPADAITSQKRVSIYERDDFRCTYCDNNFRRRIDRLSLDHLTPASQNGAWYSWNLVTACRDCNEQRGNRELGAWLLLLPSETIDRAVRVILRAMKNHADVALRARVREIGEARCG